jgi:TRAP transporter 4TM/12TM fusion protein
MLAPRAWLAIAWSLFQLYTARAGIFDLLVQLPVHVACAVALGFLTPAAPEGRVRWIDGVLAVLALACSAHYVAHHERLASRMALVDDPSRMDVAVGLLLVLLLLEAARRHIGPALVILALAFVAYAFAGPWLPGFLSHGGVTFLKFMDQQTLTAEGIFGIPTLVSATYIYLFILFGAVMSHGGLLQFFTDLALAVAGGTRGGAGKVAVISSGLFGMVNGSAIANAVTTGAFTIPLMKRAGYRPEFAAAVEATASMGGQLIPPVMGAAAFIMAETLGVPYGTIALAAAIPGVLYFVAVGVMVHYEAERQGLPVLPRGELPRLGAVLRRDAHLLAGPGVLLWLLIEGRSPIVAGFWGLAAALAVSFVRSDTRIGPRTAVRILAESGVNAMPVALACTTVGIVVGVVSITGLGLKLASGIVSIASGQLFLTLVLTMVAALVLGTGLPTSATYIITSIMAAPALVELGVPKLVAHLFVFYFGILADLTPPTAISTYATSSIAGADVWRTQWVAMLLALSGFLIPFSFAYDPAMLLMGGSVVNIAWRTLSTTVGIVMLGAGIIGHFHGPTSPWQRATLIGGAALLIFPGVWTDVVGLGALAAVIVTQRRMSPVRA